MLKLSKLTDYAAVVMAHIARTPDQLFTASDIADHVQIPKPTVSKTLKMLQKGGLLISHRGAQGGYGLARAPQQITASDIIDAIEGPFGMTECSQEDALCNLQETCGVADNWQRVSLAIRQMLSSITLVQLAQKEPLQMGWFGHEPRPEQVADQRSAQQEIPLVALSGD
ncbi:SUF system Fe-S cluster assembly regulator [Oceanospirillum sediminis]|uniref:SUF system Fe-S cluster assembly regulator n=1 Tax=Oceanospirillum sediminis TaxID=2760088 RepID=A0A839IJS2_9GAMM|nr:SUF system Fe-S cluster assembly regulator [Oceanospirillum sediminis]MBB1485178.1 SUF system Fe-S cluster assembly regulator [Oceanospirillum sediminis]